MQRLVRRFRKAVRWIDRSVRVIVVLTLVLQPVGTPGVGLLGWPTRVAAAEGDASSVTPQESTIPSEPAETKSASEEPQPASSEGVQANADSEALPTPIDTPSVADPTTSTPAEETPAPLADTHPITDNTTTSGASDAVDTPTVETSPASSDTPADDVTHDQGQSECLSSDQALTVSDSNDWEWNADGTKATTRKSVELGVTYAFPGNHNVQVTFTCLPKGKSDRSSLSIERIPADTVTFPVGMQVVSGALYDITTGMDNGSFKYDLSLPKSSNKKAELKVAYIEKSSTAVQDEALNGKDVKTVATDDVTVKGARVEVTDLDHFTVFAVIDVTPITITATKIVCTDEADLPNYGEVGGPTMTASTATDWVENHKSCHLVPDWKFQWSYDGVENPGDNTGVAGGDWHTFGPTGNDGETDVVISELVESGSTLKLREVWQDDYLPFTFGEHGDNSNPKSAEFYCADDVINYDNWDFIGDPTPGAHYYCVAWNQINPGTIVIKKQADPAQSEEKFGFTSNFSDAFSLADGETFTAEALLPGTYSVAENASQGWTLDHVICSDGSEPDAINLGSGETVTCTFYNQRAAQIVANKIVCADEADLPNYGEVGGPNITASTATDWVVDHSSCRLVPKWQFQWSLDGVSNPGDNTGAAGSGWNAFSGTAMIPQSVLESEEGNRLWVREVWDDNYIPFTYNGSHVNPNDDNVSAEFYCHTDVVNYDNWDFIDHPEAATTYYCVAWNVAKTGNIIIKKQTDPAGSPQTFDFSASFVKGTFDLSDGQTYSASDLMPGTYSVAELAQTGWRLDSATCSDGSDPSAIELDPNETVTCTFKNQQTARVVATKIVCTDEADLPNYGELGGPDLTATSAVDWVNTHKSCSFQKDWRFQWAYQSTSNPGDNTAESANPDWHTFGPTGVNGQATADIDLKSSALFWVREVWDDNYIPFTYNGSHVNPNDDNVSAEFYCHTDVVNYDNYDYIDASSNAPTYYCVGWNVPTKGTIVIEKQTEPNGSQQAFSFNPSWGDDNFSLTDGEQKSFTLSPATYSVEELATPDWDLTGVSCKSSREDEEAIENLNLQAGETITCVFTNTEKPGITVTATKIVCTDEADLPDYAKLGPDITSTTAVDWVENHKSCSFQKDWRFQWSLDGVPNPGDNTGEAGSDWNTFGPTDANGTVTTEINNPATSKLWFREVWDDNYISFTYNGAQEDPNSNPVSAEFYCHQDVINYDNWEWIETVPNSHYYCVAWNVPKEGSITGYKWHDLNNNAQRDCELIQKSLPFSEIALDTPVSQTCESKLGGWTIFLDDNNNGQLDEGERSTTTDEGGDYIFDHLLPGTYHVCEVIQDASWFQIYPSQVTESACHTVTVTAGAVTDGWNFGNNQSQEASPSLLLKKTNNSTGDQAPGSEVVYTLEVTALDGPVDNVTVTDLPPEGFTYVPGSGEGAPFIHEYASPGIWDLGNMAAGETKVLTYKTVINNSQDAGQYADLAFARGKSGATTILANSASDPFVGTSVNVVLPANDPSVTLDEDKKEETDHKKKTVTQYVLGAATELPLTGTPWSWAGLALFGLMLGVTLRRLGHERSMSRTPLAMVVLIGASILPVSAQAASLSVEIETPAAVVDQPNFKLGFVALDVQTRPITIECFTTAQASPFATYNLASGFGGNSGDCEVDASVMPTDGHYEFFVRAQAMGGSNETVESNHVNVKLASDVPGTPLNYHRSDPGCDNVITFRTADDGGKTVKVELYRSTHNPFTADAANRVAEQAIGSGTDGSFTQPAPSCDDDVFYALRAVDSNGHGSGFIGDTDVDTVTKTKTTTKTNKVAISGGATGAIAVNGTPLSTEPSVEGAATEKPDTAEGGLVGSASTDDGSVLGAATAAETNWFVAHPWWTVLLILFGLIMGYLGYVRWVKKGRDDADSLAS